MAGLMMDKMCRIKISICHSYFMTVMPASKSEVSQAHLPSHNGHGTLTCLCVHRAACKIYRKCVCT